MGFLDKLFVSEESPKIPDIPFADTIMMAPEAPPVSVDAEVSILDIYDKAGLGDPAKSILRVSDILNALPNSMTIADKKKALAGMIAVTGLTAGGLLADADARVSALEGTKAAFTTETENVVTSLTEHIAQLEKEIDDAKLAIQNRNKMQENEEALIKIEVDKIADLKSYLGVK